MPIQQVQTIDVVNNGGYVMSFGMQIFDMDLLQWLNIDYDSGNYPIDQDRSVDLSTITGLNVGTPVRPQVRAVWGNTATPNDFVQYGGLKTGRLQPGLLLGPH